MELTQLSLGIESNEEPFITEDYELAKKFYNANTNENSCVCLCVRADEPYFKESQKEMLSENVARILFPESNNFFENGLEMLKKTTYNKAINVKKARPYIKIF
jgi:hypothetical protein